MAWKGSASASDVWHRSDEWETPPLFAALDAEFHFTLDVAALPFNVKYEPFFTREADALLQSWGGMCWCNPPFGFVLRQWLRKARESARSGAIVVCLSPAQTDTLWWHEYVLPHAKSAIFSAG